MLLMKIMGILFMILAGAGVEDIISDFQDGRDFDEQLLFSVTVIAAVGIAFIMI